MNFRKLIIPSGCCALFIAGGLFLWQWSEDRSARALMEVNHENAALYAVARDEMVAAAVRAAEEETARVEDQRRRQELSRQYHEREETRWARLLALRDELALLEARRGADVQTAITRANRSLTDRIETELALLRKMPDSPATAARIKESELELWQMQQRTAVPGITQAK